SQNIATEEELSELEKDIKKQVRDGKKKAWENLSKPIENEKKKVIELLEKLSKTTDQGNFISILKEELSQKTEPLKSDYFSAARKALRYVAHENSPEKTNLLNWIS